MRPICEYSHDGDQYKVSGSAEGFPERSKNFVLNVEQEETTMDGRKVKVNVPRMIKFNSLVSYSKFPRHIKQSTYKRNGKSMTQMEVQENGSTIVYDREIKGDEMHVVCAQLFNNNYALIDLQNVLNCCLISNRKSLMATSSPIESSKDCKWQHWNR